MNYGLIIKELRVSKMKQNQTEFAEGCGITQTYLSQLETGHKKPSTDLLEKIANHVDVPLPIIFWKSITENHISEDKRESFKRLKPSIDNLIMSFF